MKKLLGSIAIAAGALLTGCSPFSLVNSETYNNADLAQYTTYHLVAPDEGTLPPGMQMVTYYNIAAAIREQMMERGFTETDDSPLLVNIGLTVHREIATEPALPPGYPTYPGPYYNGFYPYFMYPRYNYWANYYANAQVITGIYKEGVLTMDFIRSYLCIRLRWQLFLRTATRSSAISRASPKRSRHFSPNFPFPFFPSTGSSGMNG